VGGICAEGGGYLCGRWGGICVEGGGLSV
jgi:hypothetical protein